MPHSTVPQRSLLKRTIGHLGRFALTLSLVGLCIGAAIGGRSILAARASAAPAPDAAPATPVTVHRIEIEDGYAATRRFSGQFEARQRSDLSFEQPGTVAAILVREGDAVVAGQVVARLDTRLLDAERARLAASRASMAAQVELARRTNDRQAELRERGFAPDQSFDESSLRLVQMEAGIAEIDAGLLSVDVSISKSALLAPFAGIVTARGMDIGAVASPAAPVLTLTEDGPPRFVTGLDPAMADALTLGGDAVIEAGGLRLPAMLSALSPSLDPATRSRMAWFEIVVGPAPPDRGAGELVLTQRIAHPGAWVPLAALRAGPRATWALTTVRDGTIGVEAAEILHLDGERAFVRGTYQDGMPYLPDGAHRVVPGQTVTISEVVSEAVAWVR